MKYQPKLRLTPEETAAAGMLQVSATVMPISSSDEVQAAVKSSVKGLLRGEDKGESLRALWRQRRELPLVARAGWRYAVQHRAYIPADSRLELRVHCEQEPDGQSRVTLAEERDRFGLRRTRLEWRISARELASIRTFVERVAGALKDVARVVPQAGLLGEDAGLLARCDDSYHHMGGMRMHRDPQQGVVTPELRLHGTRNVYVCSAAVFPTSGSSNPTHTVLALAMRLVEALTRN